MTTKEFNEEISKWKKIDNLIDWKKHTYSSFFPHIYWVGGIIFLVLSYIVFQAKSSIINFLGVYPWAFIVIIFTLLFIIMLILIARAHSQANEDIEYLYRKKDRQKV